MQRLLWIGGILVGAAAVAGLVTVATRKKQRELRVALIGDSLAVGLAPELRKLAGQTPFKAEGHVGISTTGWVKCATCGEWLAEFSPSIVVIVLGTNDDGMPVRADFEAVRDASLRTGARVVWVQPPAGMKFPVTPTRKVIDSLGVEVVPAAQVTFGADGVHPAEYATWAKIIWQQVV